MNLKLILPLMFGVELLLGACSNLYEPKPQLTQLDDQTVLTNTASLSHVIIYNKKSNNYSCAQPAPDAAFNQGESSDFSISLVSLGDSNDSGDQESSSEETEMTGRTPTVLMTRELFYRLCEFSKNHNLDKEEAKELYTKTLATVKAVWAIEAGKTSVKIGETITTNHTTNVTSLTPVKLPTQSSSSPPPNSPQPDPATETGCAALSGSWDPNGTPPCT